jgi:hypothetical protein
MSIGTAPVANQTLTVKGNDTTANYALVLTDSADVTQFGFKNNGELELTALGKVTYSDGFGGSVVSNTTTAARTWTFPDASGDILLSNLLGVANGIATLDAGGKVPTSQLPFELMEFLGNWDASTNTPTLANTDVGKQGNTYRVSVAGTVDFGAGNITFAVGDWCYNTGSIWEKGINTDTVFSVNGQQGTVLLGLADILSQSNLTGANNISINSGQTITYNVGSGGNLNSLTTTGARTWNLPDASGTIALTSDIVAEDLATTLSAGNTSGANNIVMSTSLGLRKIIGEGAQWQLAISSGGIGMYKNDFLDGSMVIIGSQAYMQSAIGNLDYVRFTASTNQFFFQKVGAGIAYIRVDDPIVFELQGAGAGQVALGRSLLTGARTQEFQDANGTIALLSDIPSAQDLATTLGTGNTTGANDIVVSATGGNRKIVTDNATSANSVMLSFLNSANMDTLVIAKQGLDLGGSLTIAEANSVLSYLESGGASFNEFRVSNTGFLFDRTGTGQKDLTLSEKIDFKIQSKDAAAFYGEFTSGNITANRTYTFQNASGTVAFLSDIGGANSLSATLAIGNTTGANNIIVTDGQDIRSSLGGGTLNLNDPFGVNGTWSITSDNTAYGANSAWIYGEPNDGSQLAYQRTASEAIGIGVFRQGTSPQLFNAKEVVIIDNTSAQASSGITIGRRRATFIGAENSKINSGLQQTVVAGATGITATASDALYTNELRLQKGVLFDGIFSLATLTANRTYTFQNASGTVAFLSDIGAASLSAVLAVGNTSGANDIEIDSGQSLVVGGNTVSTSMTNGITMYDGTAPSASIANSAALYVDVISAGNAAFHMRTEAGDIIKHYKVSTGWSITNLTTDRTYNANTTNINEIADVLGTLIEDLKLTGYITS